MVSLCVALALATTACSSRIESSMDDAGGATDARTSDARSSALDAQGTGDAPASDDALGPTACPCLAGEGTYCEAELAALADAEGCVVEGASAAGDRLFACSGGTWSIGETCAAGCASGETGASAACELPICDCFVRVSWCGASAARHALGLDPPCRVPLVPEHDDDVLGCDGDRWVVLEACAEAARRWRPARPTRASRARRPRTRAGPRARLGRSSTRAFTPRPRIACAARA